MREQVLISFVYSVQSNLVDACSTFNVSTALSQSVFFLLTAQSLISFVAHYTGTYLMNWVAVAYNILCPFPKRIYLFFMFKFTFLPEYGSRQDHGEKNCGSSYIEFFDLGLQSTSQRTSASLVTRRMIYPLSNRCASAYLGTTLLFDFRFYFLQFGRCCNKVCARITKVTRRASLCLGTLAMCSSAVKTLTSIGELLISHMPVCVSPTELVT